MSHDIGGFHVAPSPNGIGEVRIAVKAAGVPDLVETVITVDQARALATVLIIVAELAANDVEQPTAPSQPDPAASQSSNESVEKGPA